MRASKQRIGNVTGGEGLCMRVRGEAAEKGRDPGLLGEEILQQGVQEQGQGAAHSGEPDRAGQEKGGETQRQGLRQLRTSAATDLGRSEGDQDTAGDASWRADVRKAVSGDTRPGSGRSDSPNRPISEVIAIDIVGCPHCGALKGQNCQSSYKKEMRSGMHSMRRSEMQSWRKGHRADYEAIRRRMLMDSREPEFGMTSCG